MAQLGLALADRTHGAAASINGALCSRRSQMPSPSSPHAERVLCVHNQPLSSPGVSWGTKHHLFPLAETGAPRLGSGLGTASARAASKGRVPGKSESQRTHVASSGVPLAMPRCHPTRGHRTCPHSSFPGHPAPSRSCLRKDRARLYLIPNTSL